MNKDFLDLLRERFPNNRIVRDADEYYSRHENRKEKLGWLGIVMVVLATILITLLKN